jgi:hypothetical protein
MDLYGTCLYDNKEYFRIVLWNGDLLIPYVAMTVLTHQQITFAIKMWNAAGIKNPYGYLLLKR